MTGLNSRRTQDELWLTQTIESTGEWGNKKCNLVRPTHLSTKQMVGLKPEVKNDLSKFFGLNGIEEHGAPKGTILELFERFRGILAVNLSSLLYWNDWPDASFYANPTGAAT